MQASPQPLLWQQHAPASTWRETKCVAVNQDKAKCSAQGSNPCPWLSPPWRLTLHFCLRSAWQPASAKLPHMVHFSNSLWLFQNTPLSSVQPLFSQLWHIKELFWLKSCSFPVGWELTGGSLSCSQFSVSSPSLSLSFLICKLTMITVSTTVTVVVRLRWTEDIKHLVQHLVQRKGSISVDSCSAYVSASVSAYVKGLTCLSFHYMFHMHYVI